MIKAISATSAAAEPITRLKTRKADRDGLVAAAGVLGVRLICLLAILKSCEYGRLLVLIDSWYPLNKLVATLGSRVAGGAVFFRMQRWSYNLGWATPLKSGQLIA